MLSEISQTKKQKKKTHITWFHLYEISRIGKLSGLVGKEDAKLLLNGSRVSVWDDEKSTGDGW